ncbi:Fc.00g034260.m01.CDS01 [Cosmosporella sp. VM-42]
MGLFKESSKNHTCPVHSLSEDADQHFLGDMSFHNFNVILSGSCAAFAIITMLAFKQMHATHLLKPNEQIKIMKIGSLITMYSTICFLSVCFPKAEVYVHPWLDFVEAIALGSFFLLLCEYISPNHEQRYVFFAARRIDGVKWFKSRWFMIFQFPIVSLVVSVATDITQAAGIYCEWGSGVHFAKFWLSIIRTISLTASIMSILQFYKVIKTDLAQHRPLVKLIAFKAVVFLTFVQSILFWILTDVKALKPTKTLTYADVNIGIPNLLICVEMVPLSVFFIWAYPWTVYSCTNASLSLEGANGPVNFRQTYQGGPLGIRAWIEMFNPTEITRAILFGIQMIGNRGTNVEDGYERTENEPLDNDSYQSQTYPLRTRRPNMK